MRVLIADDDSVSRRMLETAVARMGYEVESRADGIQAWERLRQPDSPLLAVLDWMMPGLDGVDVCRRVRAQRPAATGYIYVIMLTAKGQKQDLIAGLEAGADDYLVKPFDPQELRSRLAVGQRILELQAQLEHKVEELQDALHHVKQLQGLLPICMHCKKIRDDADTWHRLETYIEKHSQAAFTHSLCADCRREHYPDIQPLVRRG